MQWLMKCRPSCSKGLTSDNNNKNNNKHNNDDEDDDIEVLEERSAVPKSATIDKLKACGISVSRQAPPKVPKGIRLPPGKTKI